MKMREFRRYVDMAQELYADRDEPVVMQDVDNMILSDRLGVPPELIENARWPGEYTPAMLELHAEMAPARVHVEEYEPWKVSVVTGDKCSKCPIVCTKDVCDSDKKMLCYVREMRTRDLRYVGKELHQKLIDRSTDDWEYSEHSSVTSVINRVIDSNFTPWRKSQS